MTEAEKTFCENWCKAHAKTWQVLNRSQWKYQFHPKTLVRYVDEIRQSETEIQLILEFLSSSDCIDTLSLYDQSISNTWKPTRAWLEVANKSVQGVRSIRLYHGLMTDSTQAGDGPYVVDDGCAYKISFTYYWNQQSAPTCPQSSSGVSYQISGLSRDADTGLYTYAIEKRERVQQDVAEYITATDAFAKVTEEYHLGVKQSDVSTTGKEASFGNGKVVKRKISKNSDCTSDVHNTTTEEREVAGYSETVHVGVEGKTVTTINRNMADKADASNLDIGESVENTKTEGGRWNQTIRKVRNYLLHVGDSCRKTIFAHTHTTSNVQGEDPGFSHVVDAKNGKIVETRVRRTDGGYAIEESETQEQSVSDAVVTKKMTLSGLTVRRTSKSQSSALPDPTEVGRSVTNEKTPGGLYDTTEEVAGSQGAGKVSESHSETALHVNDANTQNLSKDDAAQVNVGDATLKSDGTIERKAKRKNENGTSDVTTETVKPKEHVKTFTWSDSSSTHTLCKYNNQKEPLKPSTSGDYVSVSCNYSVNEHGLYDGSYTITVRDGGGGGASIHTTTSSYKEFIQYATEEIYGKTTRFGISFTVTERRHYNTNSSWLPIAMDDIAEATRSWTTDKVGMPAKYKSRIEMSHVWVTYTFSGFKEEKHTES